MHDKLVIIGAGGHGRVCAEIAELCGYKEIIFLDDNDSDVVSVSGKTSDIQNYLDDYDFFVGIGNNDIRFRFYQLIAEKSGSFATLIHPSAVVSKDAVVEDGCAVMGGVVINTGARIKKGAVINTCSSVDHDCVVGDFAHISVGAHLAGTVHVGNLSFVGAGATIINNINIQGNCVIGAGAVVTSDIVESGIYVGVPARILK